MEQHIQADRLINQICCNKINQLLSELNLFSSPIGDLHELSNGVLLVELVEFFEYAIFQQTPERLRRKDRQSLERNRMPATLSNMDFVAEWLRIEGFTWKRSIRLIFEELKGSDVELEKFKAAEKAGHNVTSILRQQQSMIYARSIAYIAALCYAIFNIFLRHHQQLSHVVARYNFILRDDELLHIMFYTKWKLTDEELLLKDLEYMRLKDRCELLEIENRRLQEIGQFFRIKRVNGQLVPVTDDSIRDSFIETLAVNNGNKVNGLKKFGNGRDILENNSPNGSKVESYDSNEINSVSSATLSNNLEMISIGTMTDICGLDKEIWIKFGSTDSRDRSMTTSNSHNNINQKNSTNPNFNTLQSRQQYDIKQNVEQFETNLDGYDFQDNDGNFRTNSKNLRNSTNSNESNESRRTRVSDNSERSNVSDDSKRTKIPVASKMIRESDELIKAKIQNELRKTKVPEKSKRDKISNEPENINAPDDSRRSNVSDESRGFNVPDDSRGSNIPNDSRRSNVSDESRGFNVPDDSRGSNIPNDSRRSDVPNDPRKFNVPNDSRESNVLNDSRESNELNESRESNVPNDSRRSNVPDDSRGSNVLDNSRESNVLNESSGSNIPNDSRGSNVPDDSKGSNVPNDPRKFNVPNDSREFNVLNESRGSNVLNESRGFNVSDDSRGSNVPNDSRESNVLNESRGSNIPNNSRRSNVPNDSRESNVPNDPRKFNVLNNSIRSNVPNDSRRSNVADDSIRSDVPNDSRKSNVTNGSKGTRVPDKLKKTKVSDGSEKTKVSNKSRKTKVPDGSERNKMPDESRRTDTTDGSKETRIPDESKNSIKDSNSTKMDNILEKSKHINNSKESNDTGLSKVFEEVVEEYEEYSTDDDDNVDYYDENGKCFRIKFEKNRRKIDLALHGDHSQSSPSTNRYLRKSIKPIYVIHRGDSLSSLAQSKQSTTTAETTATIDDIEQEKEVSSKQTVVPNGTNLDYAQEETTSQPQQYPDQHFNHHHYHQQPEQQPQQILSLKSNPLNDEQLQNRIIISRLLAELSYEKGKAKKIRQTNQEYI